MCFLFPINQFFCINDIFFSHHLNSINSDFKFNFRRRNANVGSNGSATQMPSPPPFMTGYLNMPQPFMPGMAFAQQNANQSQSQQYTPEQYALAQQMAMQNMMQQMYLQYMNQYATTMQQSNPAPNVPFIPTNYFPQPNFGMPQQFSAAAANTNSMNLPNLNSDQQQAPQQDGAPQVPPAPRFQPVAAADDEAENRDWLEILYTLSRLLVLLSLVYFYSSPGRCSIVIIVIVLYYL